MCIDINKIIPEDIHIVIGKYLNDRSLYNLLLSSKSNFNIQKKEIKIRYQYLLDKYNREEMIKKYCPKGFWYNCYEGCQTWYINLFLKIKNKKKWKNSIVSETVKELGYSIISEAVNDLHNIIKLIQAGYNGYHKDTTNIIFILMPWSCQNQKLLYFLKKMLKYGILNAKVTNMSGSYPIFHAVIYNNYDAVKILAENGNGLETLTNSQLDHLISISKKCDCIYTYLIRYKMKQVESQVVK